MMAELGIWPAIGRNRVRFGYHGWAMWGWGPARSTAADLSINRMAAATPSNDSLIEDPCTLPGFM